ncbi:MAG: hypothetical protein INH02_14120 [Gemmatimonas sp.]|uniref:hypothetical protein n=1 Tax=Gemmatimonas sp. TaxID=1962908 RepID=UPI0025BF6328|nr:hypothetical protein [Gemmatimonas sp.]MCA2988551.1 hypothetical protein [Gemmatimonas sp.]
MSLVLVVTAACTGAAEKEAQAILPESPSATGRELVGGVENVEVKATGNGRTREEAIRDATLRAVEQVHGRAISLMTVSQEVASIDMSRSVESNGARSAAQQSARITAGGRRLMESTAGLVTSIVVEQDVENRGAWEVRITATIAKYVPPTVAKPTVVVGTPRGVDATGPEAGALRDRIASAILTSGEFAVLDRSSNADLVAELDFASSDNVAATEALKRSQARIADFVVQLSVSALTVNRQARRMRTTSREIVQYSGGAEVDYKVVHVASRQVLAAGTGTARRQSEEALQDDVDAEQWKREMLEEISDKLSTEITAALGRSSNGAGRP